MQQIIDEVDTEGDVIVIRRYKLNNSTAEDVAQIIESLISGQNQTR